MDQEHSEHSEKLRHRDLNWLSFNERVLQEAENRQFNPLYERIKFLAIYSANLDEYFRVRVSQLRQIKRVEKSIRKKLTFRPNRTVKKILKKIREQQERFGSVFHTQIIPELRENKIVLLQSGDYKDSMAEQVEIWFAENLKEHIKTQLIDFSKDEELFLENQSLYHCVTFKNKNKLGFVKIPTENSSRFLELGKKNENHYITFIDDTIRYKIDSCFPEEEINGVYEIKLSRDAELYLDDEVDGILAERIYQSLEQRQKGQATRLLYDASLPKEQAKKLRKLLKLGKIDMMPGGRYHNFNDFFNFPDPTKNAGLHYKKMPNIRHAGLENASNYFEVIREKDQLVHFPYMSFSYVEKFVAQAADDPNVKDIKISLYRIAEESALTSCLIKAISKGKNVTIFIEAKARFDEENNISWGRKFEEKGARVIYSYPRIKVHSKILLISRQEDKKIRKYAYIATGNFNDKTSKIYADHGLFTAQKKLTKELNRVFKVLEGELIIPRNKHLLVSPFTTRRNIEKYINQEMENSRNGKRSGIQAKMNSLEDPDLIDLLYKASQAGVKIHLLIRGFCCLIPGIPGLSENITVTSVIDRYLEHGRIYLFHNDGNERLYIGSADWMTRNLDRRIEVLTPVHDTDLFEELKTILTIQLSDNCKARIQDAEESNRYVQQKPGEPVIRSQYAIYQYLKEKQQKK